MGRLLKKCQGHGPPEGKQNSAPQAPCGLAGAIALGPALHWHQDQPGAQSPRPAPAPPPAGASRPPGRALACRCSRTSRSTGDRRARAVETRCVSRSRPNRRKHCPCHSAAPGSGPAGGPKPTASARPAHGGRWPAVLRAAQVFADAACRGGRNAGRGPASRPQDQSLSPDRKEFPGRNADSPLSAPCSGVKPDLHTGPRTLFVIWSHRFHGRRCAASAGSQLSSRALAALEQPSPTQRLGA